MSDIYGICEHFEGCKNILCGHIKKHRMTQVCNVGLCSQWEVLGKLGQKIIGTAECHPIEEEIIERPSKRLIELEEE